MSNRQSPQQTLSHQELVRAAVLAPSPDNNQPWRFVSRGDELQVYLNPDRALPSDVNAMFDLVGLGAAIENACIAARHAGYDPRILYSGSADDASTPIATITFAAGGRPDPLFAQLETRCTCRKLFSTRPLPEDRLQKLADAATPLDEVQVNWITDRVQIGRFSRLIAASDLIRFQYEPFHNELFRQLRFSSQDAERTRDGLDLRTLELPPGAGILLRQLRPWGRMKWIHRLGLGRLLTVPSSLSVRKSGAIGMLSVSEPTTKSFVRGGQAFQRVWLTAAAEGVSLHPLGSLPIFLAHLDQLAGQRLSTKHQKTVEGLRDRLRDLVPDIQGRTAQIMFRLGIANAPKHRSLRRPIEEVYR